jgi:hypothetical protein
MEKEELLGNIFQVDESDLTISVSEILQFTDEESIFELVFGFRPSIGEKVTSPFREDNNPNCWFETSPHGDLRFIDFGNPEVINGVKMFNMNCFNAIKVYYQLDTFQQTLSFINKAIRENKISSIKFTKKKIIPIQKGETKITFRPREFNQHDKNFWNQYGISKKNLIDDKVFAVECFKIEKELTHNIIIYPYDICYIYTDFKKSHKKIYRPHKLKNRFITNCSKNDIGSVSDLLYTSNRLYITKSYKDCRVLRNINLESIWLQNEGMFPDKEILFPIVQRYDKVFIFFDNDYTGSIASKALNERLTSWGINSESIELPDKDIKDPSDLLKLHKNKKVLINFIKNNNNNTCEK